MRLLLHSLIAYLVLAASPLAFADRQGGGGLLTSARVSVDKWIDFDASLIPDVIPDLNLATSKPGTEFVRFKSAQGDQVTFDYTWINGAKSSAGQVTLNKARLSNEGAEIVRALVESKSTSAWKQIL